MRRGVILLILFLGLFLSAQTVVPIDSIQGYTTSSPYVDSTVTTYGVVTGVYSYGFFMEEKPGGPWKGIYVYMGYGWTPNVSVGDSVEVTGTVSEYYGLTEIGGNPTVNVLGSTTPPDPVDVSTGAANDEQYEGVLIVVDSAVCESLPDTYGQWIVDDGSGNLMIDDMGISFSPTLGDTYTITGPLYYGYGRYKLEPRDANDIVGPLHFAAHTIYEIQGQTSSSPYVDSNVVFTGIVSGVFSRGYFVEETPFEPWHGIYVYTNSAPSVSLGDSVLVKGTVSEYRGMTEITLFSDSVLSSGHTVTPYLTTTGDVNLESHEGLLVKVQNAAVVDTGLPGAEFTINDGSGICRVDNWGVTLNPNPGEILTVVGPVNVYNDTAKIEPRDSSDVSGLPEEKPEPPALNIPSITGGFTLNFTLKKTTNLEIGIYDVNGRLIKNLFKGIVRAGKPMSIKLPDLTTGVFFLVVKTDGGKNVSKFIYF